MMTLFVPLSMASVDLAVKIHGSEPTRCEGWFQANRPQIASAPKVAIVVLGVLQRRPPDRLRHDALLKAGNQRQCPLNRRPHGWQRKR